MVKSKSVRKVSFHAGVYLGAQVVNYAAVGKDRTLAIDLTDSGVYVLSRSTTGEVHTFVPFGNITCMDLDPAQAIAKGEKKSE